MVNEGRAANRYLSRDIILQRCYDEKTLIGRREKGALTEAQAEERFKKWSDEKAGKILGKHDRLKDESAKKAKDRHKAESASKEAKAAKLAEKQAAREAVLKQVSAESGENTDAPASGEAN